jgi:hypothetical protein
MAYHVAATTPIQHGVVFIYDPTMIVDVPPDTSATAILSTADCISLWTVHDIDGPTNLVLTNRYDGDDCRLVFSGLLITDGGRLAFNNSSGEAILEIETGSDAAEVAIYVNDPEEPSKVVCAAMPKSP